MKKLLRYALLCAVAMFSQAVVAETTVGNVDNTTPWWSAFSDVIKVEPNKTLTMEFMNYNDLGMNWDNACLILAKTLGHSAAPENPFYYEGYGEFAVLRLDNFGWGDAYDADMVSSNWDWDNFMTILNGARVVLTVKRSGSEVAVRYDVKGTDNNDYYQQFMLNIDENADIYASLTVENAHIVINDAATAITDTETPVEGLIGQMDNSTAWWTAFSEYFTIEPNKTLTLKFQNFSDKLFNYHNWLAVVTTDADRGADDYAEYFVLRADNYAWGSGHNTFDQTDGWDFTLDSFFNWDTFMDDMDGATVSLTIERMNEKVTVSADITTVNGDTYFEKFSLNCGDGTQTIRAFLTVEGGHLLLDQSATTITDTEMPQVITIEGTQIGLLDLTTPWWTAFSDYFTLQKNQVLELDFTNYSNKLNNYDNWLLAVTTDCDRPVPSAPAHLAAAAYEEYFVLRADAYCWGKYGNSNPDDAAYYEGYQLTNNYNFATFKDDMYGAKVKLTLTRDGAKITAHADVTTLTGDEYYETLVVDNCDDGEQAVRAFLTIEGGCIDLTNSEIKDNPNPSTGITTVKATSASAVRYNLAGQRVGADYKGVVIENGHKMMVK